MTDILKGVLKPFVGLAIPLSMVVVGAGLVGLSDKFDSVVLMWIGLAIGAVGLVWGLILLLWYSSA